MLGVLESGNMGRAVLMPRGEAHDPRSQLEIILVKGGGDRKQDGQDTIEECPSPPEHRTTGQWTAASCL